MIPEKLSVLEHAAMDCIAALETEEQCRDLAALFHAYRELVAAKADLFKGFENRLEL